MNQISQRLSTVTKYTVAGVLFGCCFPLGATVLELVGLGRTFSLADIIAVQRAQPLHWIIDVAPLSSDWLAS